MSEFLRTLTRKNSLRKQCQELSVEDLRKVLGDITEILQEHEAAALAISEAEKEKAEKIELIRKAMAESGIDYADLKDIVNAAPKKKVEAKYRVVVDGVTHEWSGRGRTPVIFQQYFDDNKVTKDSCLIK